MAIASVSDAVKHAVKPAVGAAVLLRWVGSTRGPLHLYDRHDGTAGRPRSLCWHSAEAVPVAQGSNAPMRTRIALSLLHGVCVWYSSRAAGCWARLSSRGDSLVALGLDLMDSAFESCLDPCVGCEPSAGVFLTCAMSFERTCHLITPPNV